MWVYTFSAFGSCPPLFNVNEKEPHEEALLELERQERIAKFERENEVARFKSITLQAEEEARRRKTLEDAQAASYSSSLKSTAESFKWMPAIVAGTLALGAGAAAFFFRS